MSRAYVIKASESASRVVRVEDGVCAGLELIDVLPREQMGGLLAEELKGRGFAIEGKKAERVEKDGTRITIDLEEGTVTVKLSEQETVEAKVERSRVVGEEQRANAQQNLDAEVRKALEREVERRREGLREEVTKRLEKKLKDLQKELDEVTNKTTAEALKVRARQIGEIEEVHEEKDGSITIKVRT